MKAKKRLDQLLADETFQDDVLNLSQSSQKVILEKYAITKKELVYARRLFFGMRCRKMELGTGDMNYALKKLMKNIVNKPVFLKETKANKSYLITLISKIAAVLSVPLLLSTIYFYQESRHFDNVQYASFNTIEAPPGAKTQVVLPDGSIVWLNSGSSLSYPSIFDPKSRNVELKGEAYFEVVKNKRVPMIVTTNQNMQVKVYGTTFNVNTFADNGFVETTLIEGKVTIIPGNSKKEYLLEPGNSASYSVKGNSLQVNKVKDMYAYTGWKDGKLLFHDEHFSDIIRKLERWYNVDISLTDSSLGNYILYATFFDENIEQVLDILSNSIPISVDYPKRYKQADGSYSKRKIIIKRNYKRK